MRRSPRQKSVFKSLLNCTSEMSLSRNVTGREFQRHGPATEKLLSPSNVMGGWKSTYEKAKDIHKFSISLVNKYYLKQIK